MDKNVLSMLCLVHSAYFLLVLNKYNELHEKWIFLYCAVLICAIRIDYHGKVFDVVRA